MRHISSRRGGRGRKQAAWMASIGTSGVLALRSVGSACLAMRVHGDLSAVLFSFASFFFLEGVIYG